MFLMILLAGASPVDGNVTGVDDWHKATIMRIATGDPIGSPMYLQVRAGDLDGDGADDDAVLKLVCTNGSVSQSHYQIVSPRDTASGQATGKRMHNPVVITKEWGAAPARLSQMKPTYDVKTIKGARGAADAEGWRPITLASTEGLCAAGDAARFPKTRSNIQNN